MAIQAPPCKCGHEHPEINICRTSLKVQIRCPVCGEETPKLGNLALAMNNWRQRTGGTSKGSAHV